MLVESDLARDVVLRAIHQRRDVRCRQVTRLDVRFTDQACEVLFDVFDHLLQIIADGRRLRQGILQGMLLVKGRGVDEVGGTPDVVRHDTRSVAVAVGSIVG